MATDNPISYVNYDFDDLVVDLQNRLKATNAWVDTYRSSTGQMLIELLAYVGNLVLYYVERRAEESFIATAQNFSSVINLVKLLNYIPKRKTSASGAITFTLSVAATKIVIIPKYTECQTSSGVKYLTDEATTILVGGTSVSPVSIQGELIELEFVSDGSIDQQYKVNDTSVEDSADTTNPSLRVYVQGVEWTKVTSFLSSLNTSMHYRLIAELDGTISIKFGNDIKGASPEIGGVIAVRYVKSDGIDGNVYSAASITTINNIIYDEDGDAVTTITVTNSGLLLGGDAAEDIEEVRAEAPLVFATGQRAVTKADFIAILENFAGVANANVWGENEVALAAGTAADATSLNTVFLSVMLQEWQLPDSDFKSTLSTALYNQSMLAIKYEFDDPTVLNIIPVLDVIVNSGFTVSEAQSAIATQLAAEFLLGTTTKIGTMMKYSNILSALDTLNEISYLTMILKIYTALVTTSDSSFDYTATLAGDVVKVETVEIYVGTEQVAIDDGAGVFTDMSTSYTVTGTIDYTTGALAVSISPSPPNNVSAKYQQNEEGNIVTDFDEIAKLYDTEYTAIAVET